MSDPQILNRLRRIVMLLGWQAAVSAALLCLGGIVLGLPFWALGLLELSQLVLMYAAYLLSTLVPSSFALIRHRMHPLIAAGQTVTAFGFAWLISPLLDAGLLTIWTVLFDLQRPRLIEWHMPVLLPVALCTLAVVFNALLVGRPAMRRRAFGTLAAGTVLLALTSMPSIRGPWLYRSLELPVTHLVNTSKHPVQINYFRERLPKPTVASGGLAVLDGNLLLLTGDGVFYELAFSAEGNRLDVRDLRRRAPLNSAAFEETNPGLKGFLKKRFRAMDVLVIDAPDSGERSLLVSHHYWKTEQACFVIRVSALASPWQDFLSASGPVQWRTVYETQPCLPIRVNGKNFFTGHQAGGMLAQSAPQRILLALGDHGFDGAQTDLDLPQDPHSDYGKIVEINLSDGRGRTVTSGHRSPAGLHLDRHGRIWLTEHGPRGGDELNRIQFGSNYGWPRQTLGSQYGMFAWIHEENEATGSTFEMPVFAWTPSIGISAMASLNGGEFFRWDGNLIVASLAARSIYRVYLDGDVPVMAESIPVYERIRDVVEDNRGRIIFWTDSSVIGLMRVQ